MAAPALSFVIPLYRSAETIGAVVREIEAMEVPGGHEIVLVHDGSGEETSRVARELVRTARVPVTLVEHARNFGEHNAVLTGWRHARGAHLVNLDDDGQNPPAEALRMWRHACATGLDVVFGHYEDKRHAAWRNLGSWFTNRMTDWALDKPAGFYLSSFRCVSAFAARQVVGYAGPYPYLDGLLLQVTQRIGSIQVRHEDRKAGLSTYTLGRFRANVLLNHTGDYLVTPSVLAHRNIYRRARTLLNAGVAFQLRPDATLFCDVANLTNALQETYLGSPDRVQRRIVNAPTLTFGLNGRF
jgi:undecaprenyl-phosphate 4-deoxy-4-formamido-L-arabinose transferase